MKIKINKKLRLRNCDKSYEFFNVFFNCYGLSMKLVNICCYFLFLVDVLWGLVRWYLEFFGILYY